MWATQVPIIAPLTANVRNVAERAESCDSTSIPAAANGCVSSASPSVTRWSTSASGATTHGLAVRSLSAVASAITSPADATIARLTYASSWSSVVTPTSGCSEQMPSTQTSARTERSASTAAAPTVTCAGLSSRPPSSTTWARG